MPSGAKKRKAAKKKLQKEAHNTTNKDVSQPQGTDNAKSYDERETDGERNASGEKEELNLGEQSVGEYSNELKPEENSDDVMNAEDDADKTKNGKHKSCSSSSSSSEDDEVPIEKEKPVMSETGELKQQVLSSSSEVSMENPVISNVYSSIEERIPFEESVKQVLSLPQEESTESAAIDDSMISHVLRSEVKQKMDEVLPSADEKDKLSSGVKDFVLEKLDTKVIQIVDEGVGNLSESADITPRDEGLPESCDVRSADACCEDNHAKESETQKYIEEQPLISSATLPVQRTSWMNCCGLFEVFSGGASR
ncbi:Multidrug resistance-associated protein 1 [Bienertia sinuspersici]